MEKIKELFVVHEIATLLKEKGFDEPCFGAFNLSDELKISNELSCSVNQDMCMRVFGGISAPTYDQVIDWLYKKGISLEIYTCSDNRGNCFNHLIRKVGKMIYEIRTLDNKCVPDRREAYNKGIKEALKLI
jgi:hypothetical protein